MGGGRLFSSKSVFSYSKWVMSNTNDLVLTESNARPGKLWPGVLMMSQEMSRACLPPVESRHGSSGQASRAGWKGNSSLHFGGTK